MNVPKLRFGEFEGEWQETTIGSIAEVTTGNKDTQNRVDDGTYPFFVRSQTVERINSFAYDGEAILTSGDGVGVGKNFHYINGKFDFHQRVYCIYKFRLKIYGKFVYSYFSEKFNQRVMQLSAKNSVDSVRRTMVTEMPINLPYYEEQQKIADFLSAVDEKITALTAQKTALTQYKQGMMQRIFSQTLRFKDDNGADYPDWKNVMFGDIASFSKGKGISKADISDGGKLECIRYGELYTYYKETIKNVVSRTNQLPSALVLSEANDVIIPASGETQLDIATASCVLKAGVALGGDLNIIKSDVDGVFLAYYLNNAKKQSIANLAQGISVVHLYASQLKTMDLDIPEKQEQQKIAQFLTELDNKINAVDAQIQSAQQWKQGLLQQMFV